MKAKIISRLLIFFVGLPVVIGLVYFKQFHHLPLHLLIIFMSCMGANELYNLLSTKYKLQPRPLVLAMNTILPVFTLVSALLGLTPSFVNYLFLAAVMFCMAYEVLAMKTFEDSLSRIMTSTFIILYTGFLLTFLSRMTTHESSREYISVFLLMVFLCDSFAWLFGNLFGKNNKGYIKASPNKSIAGFCGGILGSVFSGFLGFKFCPEVFGADLHSLYKILALGFLISILSIIGDLFESVLKRSTNIKDSGNLIPGRGGVLDSIDSIVFAVPIYYFGIEFLLQHP